LHYKLQFHVLENFRNKVTVGSGLLNFFNNKITLCYRLLKIFKEKMTFLKELAVQGRFFDWFFDSF
jgi:hypothetical protein